jgi:recombination protein RecA
VRIKVAKNKVAPPFRMAEVDLMFDGGISREGDLVDMGSDIDVIQKAGSWYSYGETKLGQGKENARQFLVDNPDIADEVELAVFEENAPNLVERRREHLEKLRETRASKAEQAHDEA